MSREKLIAIARDKLKALVRQKTLSYSSYGTLIDRWIVFIEFLVDRKSVLKIEDIDRETVISFGKSLTDATPAYAQNLVSAVNTVMTAFHVGAWDTVSATRECGIPRRDNVRVVPPGGMDEQEFRQAMIALDRRGLARGRVVAEAARYFGLRAKEASLMNYQEALDSALSKHQISVISGTKGGRPRDVPITNAREQLRVLEMGSAVQGSHFSIIPEDMTWKTFRIGEIEKTRATLKPYEILTIRDLRAVYACLRYQSLTGIPAPIFGGKLKGQLDKQVRKIIGEELGHSRLDVTNSYLGKNNGKET
ncbi:Integrase [Marinobacter sp. DSM 26671]|jgi:hypothetical protein|uniref:integrase domain-containing protein n=1 Tax=Marinobacter sp. DSM 26671 TaxID=1761793 RepID=UPI0008F0BCC6|nr:integrase domain-containing protein [Marinobacter sp. DSM 26671]SFD95440.1 Integrase [Marinobacter sp. DSM 26671]